MTAKSFALLALLAALALFGIGTARAVTTNEQAWASAKADLDAKQTQGWCGIVYGGGYVIQNPTIWDDTNAKKVGRKFECYSASANYRYYISAFYWTYDTGCISGANIDPATGKCSLCMQRSPLGPSHVTTTDFKSSVCYGGCSYNMGTGGVAVRALNETTWRTNTSGYTPSGAVCTTETPKTIATDGKECLPSGGGLTMCAREDGKLCATASNGKQFCWSPHETGTKTNGDTIAKRDAGQTATPPPPPPGDSLNQTSTPQTVQTGTKDGRSSTSTVTTYSTVSGTDAPAGTGTSVDGNGNDTSSTGTDPGAPSSGFGEPYEGTGRTVGDAVGEFKTRMEASPIRQAAGDFFSAPIVGSCPVWTVPETAFTPVLTLDIHCSAEFADIWAKAAWVVLAIAAFCAFRIAFY